MKKKIVSFLLTLAMMLTLVPVMAVPVAAATPAFSGGKGTSEEPFKLSSLSDMNSLASAVNNGTTYAGNYFIITQDITGITTPIGDNSNQFSGNIDGNGHTLTVSISQTPSVNAERFIAVGLIGRFVNGSISNLTVTGTVSCKPVPGSNETPAPGLYVGGFAGVCVDCTFNFCHNKATIIGILNKNGSGNQFAPHDGCMVGGIVGNDMGSVVINCTNSGSVTGGRYVGGIFGNCVSDLKILNCSNSGNITCDPNTGNTNTDVFYACVGGIGGNRSGGRITIENVYSTGSVNRGNSRTDFPVKLGQICGYADNFVTYGYGYYCNSGNAIGLIAAAATVIENSGGFASMTKTNMTNGTLLGKLNSTVATYNAALTEGSTDKMYTWVAGTDNYPVPIMGFDISFETNGGTAVTALSGQMAIPALDTLPTSSRAGHAFEGWYTDEALTEPAVAGTEIEKNITLYAKWTPKTARCTTGGETPVETLYPSFKAAADAVAAGSTITLLAKPEAETDESTHAFELADEINVIVPEDVTLQVNIDEVPAVGFVTAESSVFDYLKDGTLVFKSGALKISTETTLYVLKTETTPATYFEVVLMPDIAEKPMIFTRTAEGLTGITAQSADDTVVIDGVAYTPKNGETISVLSPHKPFPGSSIVSIPKDVAATVNINPELANGPTLDVDNTRSGEVILTRGESNVFPATITIAKNGDIVSVDPDGAGTASAATAYTTVTDSTDLLVDASGNVTLKTGSVNLDAGEAICLSDGSGHSAAITNPSDSGKKVMLEADKTYSDVNYPYVLTVSSDGKMVINGRTYTNSSSSTKLVLGLAVNTDNTVAVTLISGEMLLPTGEQITIGDTTVKNMTGADISAKPNENGGVDVTVDKNQFTCTGAGATFTKKEDGSVVAAMTIENAALAIKPVADDADVCVTDGTGAEFLTVNSVSAGDIGVKKTASGFELEVENGSGETSALKAGATTCTIPESKTSTISVNSADGYPYLLGSDGAVSYGDGTFFIDGVSLTNSTHEALIVFDNSEGGGDDGDLRLQIGDDRFVYNTAAAYSIADAQAGYYDLTVKKNEINTNIQFEFDRAGEKVLVKGENVQDTEFIDKDGKIYAVVYGSSLGDVTITKGSYTVDVDNTDKGASTVKLGMYTYTVPAGQKATLKIENDDVNEIAKLLSGTVELDKGTEGNGETVVIPVNKTYKLKNSTMGTVTDPVTVTKTENGANIEVPAGDAFTVITAAESKTYATAPNTGITTTYVTDGSGNVKIDDGEAEGDPEHGVKLNLDKGSVTLAIGQTIYANVPASGSKKLIYNPTDSTNTLSVNAGDGTVDTVISLAENQFVDIGGTLKNGVVTGAIRYTAANGDAQIALNKENSNYPEGTPMLKDGNVKVGAGGTLGVAGASQNYMISVDTGKPPVSIEYVDGIAKVTIPAKSGNTVGEFIVTVYGTPDMVYRYVNESSAPVTVSIKPDGKILTDLKADTAPTDLPEGDYEAYRIRISEATVTYTFSDDLDAVLAQNNTQSGDTIVLNTELASNPTTNGYVLTTDGIDIYTTQGNLTKNGKHTDVTAYSEADAVDGVDNLCTVDSRERSQQYVGNQTIADALASCMVVKVSNEEGEIGHVEVQAGEAKIKWSDTDTAYYVTLADAIYDASHNKSAGISENQYNLHDGQDSFQTIEMNINPYADRNNMAMGNGDTLVTRGENSAQPGDKYSAGFNTRITMFTGSNDVYLVSGNLRAEANPADSTDSTVTVYTGFTDFKDSSYYATSEKAIIVNAGRTSNASKFADLEGASDFAVTVENQTVTVGVGGGDTASFTGAAAGAKYQICRAGVLTGKGDSVVVEGDNTSDYTVYSLLYSGDTKNKLDIDAKYAKTVVPAANTGDTTVTCGVEEKTFGFVGIESGKSGDTFELRMPDLRHYREADQMTYVAAEDGTKAEFTSSRELQLLEGAYKLPGKQTYKINGITYYGNDDDMNFTVTHEAAYDEISAISADKSVNINFSKADQNLKYNGKTYTATNSTAAVLIPGKNKDVLSREGSFIYEDKEDASGNHFFVHGYVSTSYRIEQDEIKHGTVWTDRNVAATGTVVTVIVTPDRGYALDTLTILDINGNEVKCKKIEVNKFTFEMPSGRATIKATFKEDGTVPFFVDVEEDAYYYDAVRWAAENGITDGVNATHFAPDMGTTRAQVVTFLWRAAGCPVVNYAMNFEDISADTWYTEAVRWAASEGITAGTSATTFSPSMICTRCQIVTFIARIAGIKDDASGYSHVFTDVNAANYYNNAVAWAYENKITDGTSATTFSPNNDCTRGQIVTFLWRYFVK